MSFSHPDNETTMNQSAHEHRGLLQQLAHRAMLERGLQPEFPPRALEEVSSFIAHGQPSFRQTKEA